MRTVLPLISRRAVCPSGARSSTKSRLTCSWMNRTLQRWWISWTCIYHRYIIYLSKVYCKGPVEASAWSKCLPKDVELGNLRATGIGTEWAFPTLFVGGPFGDPPSAIMNTLHEHSLPYIVILMVVSSNSMFFYKNTCRVAGNRWNNCI